MYNADTHGTRSGLKIIVSQRPIHTRSARSAPQPAARAHTPEGGTTYNIANEHQQVSRKEARGRKTARPTHVPTREWHAQQCKNHAHTIAKMHPHLLTQDLPEAADHKAASGRGDRLSPVTLTHSRRRAHRHAHAPEVPCALRGKRGRRGARSHTATGFTCRPHMIDSG